MHTWRRAAVVGLGITLLAGCADPAAPPGRAPSLSSAAEDAGPIVTGAGHIIRDLGAGPELTTFSYNAIRRGGGDVGGHFQYNLRVGDVTISGHVTCTTTVGNVAWIGGVIDKVKSADPADQSFVATDVWWRVVDNGEGADDPPDLSTSLLLTLPGTTITAESWCRDQPVLGFLRPVNSGNITVH